MSTKKQIGLIMFNIALFVSMVLLTMISLTAANLLLKAELQERRKKNVL